MCKNCEPRFLTNNILSIDPSRTKTLRDSFVADMRRRFRWVAKEVRRVFDTKNHKEVVLNIYSFATDPQRVDEFREWLNKKVEDGIYEKVTYNPDGTYNESPEVWTDYYIKSAYKKGVSRAYTELKKLGLDVLPSIVLPVAGSEVEMMYTRTFTELKGVTDTMSQQLSRILSEGLIEGLSPKEIANRMVKQIDGLSKGRASTIARTEIIRSHHLANIALYEKAGIEGVKIKAEWSTAGDNRVCQTCSSLEGRIYPLDEIRGMIPQHPNCRCVAIPVLVDS